MFVPRFPVLSRYDEESSGNGDEANEENRKREWNNFYKKQMSLRKVSLYPFVRDSQIVCCELVLQT